MIKTMLLQMLGLKMKQPPLINGEIWRIKRTNNAPVNNHISEYALDDYRFDQILKNEGSLDDLRELVRKRIEFSLNAK